MGPTDFEITLSHCIGNWIFWSESSMSSELELLISQSFSLEAIIKTMGGEILLPYSFSRTGHLILNMHCFIYLLSKLYQAPTMYKATKELKVSI